MDTALAQLHDRLSTLEQENALLRSRLQSCERSHALLQIEMTGYQRREQRQEPARQEPTAELATVNDSSLEHRLLEATATAANALLTVSNFDEAVNTALQVIGKSLETDRLCLGKHHDDETGQTLGFVRYAYEWTSPYTFSQIQLPDAAEVSYEGIEAEYQLLRQGQEVGGLIDEFPDPFRSQQKALGVKSSYAIPIMVDGQYWGVVGFDDCREAKRRGVAELSALKVAANCIGSAIEREHIQQALLQAEQARSQELERHNAELQQTLDRLTQSEQRYRTLFELSSEGIVRFGYKEPISVNLSVDEQLDLCYQSIYISEGNRAFAQMYEYAKVEDIVGLRLSDFHDRNSQTTQAAMRAWIENRYTCRSLETEEFDRYGRKRYFLNSAISTIESGCVTSTWVSQVDITELRETQQALLEAEQARVAELAKTNTTLKNSLDRLAANPDLNAFLGHVLLEIVQQFQIELGYLYLYDADSQMLSLHLYVAQGQVWSKHELAELIPLPLRQPSIDDLPIWETLLQTRQPFVITRENAAQYVFRGTLEWQEQQQNHQTGINLLLTLQDEPIGLLSLVSTRRSFSPEELELAQALAHQATLALHLTRLAEEAKQAAIVREQEQAAQERAAELAKANAVLQRTASQLVGRQDLKHFLHSLLLEITQEVGAVNNSIFLCDHVSDFYRMHYAVQDGQVVNLETDPRFEFWQTPTPADNAGWKLIQSRGYMWSVLDIDTIHHDELCDWTIPWHRQMQHRAVMCFLLQIGGKPLGFMGLCFREAIEPSADRVSFIQTLTNQAALAIQLTQLAEAAKQAAIAREQEQAAQERAVELARANATLRRTLSWLAHEGDLNQFLERVLLEIATTTQAELAYLFVLHEPERMLELTARVIDGKLSNHPTPTEPAIFFAPFSADITPAFRLMEEQNLFLTLDMATLQPELTEIMWADTIDWHLREGRQQVASLVLKAGERSVGFLGLGFCEKREFSQQEQELIIALANQASLAILLMRLAEEAKQAAIYEERNRMASEIHDTLAQAFTGISIQLEVANPLLEQNPQAAQQILNHIRQLAENGLAEARRSVWALYPPAAEYADLAQLLYDSVEQMSRNTDTSIEVNLQGEPCPLTPILGMNLLRIGQEALTNALKHAQARTITIELVYEPDCICLIIRDDGRGFTPPDAIDNLNGGFGLMGMYERCDRIGAQLSLTSQLGQGTQILVEAPCS